MSDSSRTLERSLLKLKQSKFKAKSILSTSWIAICRSITRTKILRTIGGRALPYLHQMNATQASGLHSSCLLIRVARTQSSWVHRLPSTVHSIDSGITVLEAFVKSEGTAKIFLFIIYDRQQDFEKHITSL